MRAGPEYLCWNAKCVLVTRVGVSVAIHQVGRVVSTEATAALVALDSPFDYANFGNNLSDVKIGLIGNTRHLRVKFGR